ncbi:unnamed protein product [Bursaphelenchus xylophilus]|uniref:(pine wood nematode) hypothetical protein n=1 Tax=Bursaphelenchus xylophilus TaxID=6326 RepID=A0A1I7RP73_BURXY|nr:unnamed protein product [Bursaphelenchus xylophilus]CAG9124632.1 unnamed protein product [Bursaphelenchus xylophilus]
MPQIEYVDKLDRQVKDLLALVHLLLFLFLLSMVLGYANLGMRMHRRLQDYKRKVKRGNDPRMIVIHRIEGANLSGSERSSKKKKGQKEERIKVQKKIFFESDTNTNN